MVPHINLKGEQLACNMGTKNKENEILDMEMLYFIKKYIFTKCI